MGSAKPLHACSARITLAIMANQHGQGQSPQEGGIYLDRGWGYGAVARKPSVGRRGPFIILALFGIVYAFCSYCPQDRPVVTRRIRRCALSILSVVALFFAVPCRTIAAARLDRNWCVPWLAVRVQRLTYSDQGLFRTFMFRAPLLWAFSRGGG